MQPTEILKQEHRVIEQVLNCLEKLAETGSRDGRIDAAAAGDAIDFLRTFADKFHHAKEEENLFPMMESRGFSPDAGPTAVMRQDHVAGRALIANMAEAVDGASEGQAAAVRAFTESATAYVTLLREHIQKEDHCLFPMADQALGPEDQQALLRKFEDVGHSGAGNGVHERYLKIANDLAARCDVPRKTGSTDGDPGT